MLINEKARPLPVAFRRQEVVNHSADEAEIMLKFYTAYFVAKEELPFTKFKSQLDIQRKNGLKLNETYNNDRECTQFVGVIADTLKGKTDTKIKDAPYISIIIDGDISVSTMECKIITQGSQSKGNQGKFNWPHKSETCTCSRNVLIQIMFGPITIFFICLY